MVKKLLDKNGYALIKKYDLESLWTQSNTLASEEKNQLSLTSRALRRRLFDQLARKGFMPTHIIDVGAHMGHWSRDAHDVWPDCAFTLIEPQVEMKPQLDLFCSSVKNARWILAGAGATEGELPITVRADDPTASSFAISEEDARGHGYERRVVPLVTLDSVCKYSKLPAPQIVKIDAEGFELEVMNGARTLIGVTELFFLEVPVLDYAYPHMSNSSRILNYMINNGYEFYDITDLNRIMPDGTLGLMEVAFAKRSGVLREPSKSVG
jgi:FkbM family methyltransferase